MMTYSTCTAVLMNCVWRHRSLFLVLYAHLARDITNNYYNTLLYIVLIIWCIVFSVAKSLQLKFKNQRNPTKNYENGDFDAVSAFNHGAKLCRAALEEWSNIDRIPANVFWDVGVRFLSWKSWDFWKRHDHFRRFPKKSEVFRRRQKSAEGEVIEKTLIPQFVKNDQNNKTNISNTVCIASQRISTAYILRIYLMELSTI